MEKYSNIVKKSWCTDNNGYPEKGEEVDRYISIVPSERQLKYLELEYYNFIHFGVNTMNNVEWGKGNEDISSFNPEKLDTDQWCSVLKKTGSKAIIITAKHHDGFCLFDTKQTEHNVMNTPFGKDIVRMLSESCKKYGLKLGIYISPWDRHEKTYGTEAYNDFFVKQLTELCENYGDIFCFWFDGACGEGKNGKKQVYDWDRYYSVIRKYHPEAVITVCGPDVRWIGNEGGRVRKSEWSVIPASTEAIENIMDNSQQNSDETKKLAEAGDTDEDLGSRERIKNYRDLCFKPAEADVSINLGWFWHNNLYYLFKRNRKAEDLSKIYFDSVGGNASLLLNVPPNKDGLIDKREIKTLEKFTRLINEPFKHPVSEKKIFALTTDGHKRAKNGSVFELSEDEIGLSVSFGEKTAVSTLSLREDLRYSQRVEAFEIYAKDKEKDECKLIYEGTVIGSRKIVRLNKPIMADEIVIAVTQSRSNPVLKDIEIFR